MGSTTAARPLPEVRNLLAPDVTRWPLDSTKPVIELEGVSLAFGDKRVLDDLDLAIEPGKTTVILGCGGSGKSVLLKLMMGLIQPDHGRVLAFGRDLALVSPIEMLELRKRMGMVFQNYALFDALSVEDNVGFSLAENSGLRHAEIASRSHELLELLDLVGSERMLPGELSGGMRKRVSLARALVANPEVVLFDEPTTGLDPVMVERVDELIRLVNARYRVTSVIISHDLTSARRLADRVAFLDGGKIAFTGTFDELLASEVASVRSFVEAAKVSASVVEHLERRSSLAETPVVELTGVTKSFGAKQVLRGVDLAIYRGRTTVLIGASGSGKSVIIKHILGLLKPDSGKVLAFGEDVGAMNDLELARIRTHFGLVFQHAALLDWLSVFDNVAFPLRERPGRTDPDADARVAEVLDRLHLTEIARRMPGELSLGQRKRVGLARAIVTKPDVVIYDEPTTGQDPIRTLEIDDMIQEMQARYHLTSIVISHDMASAFRIGDMIAMLHEGVIVAFGTPDELRASSNEHVQRFIHAGVGNSPRNSPRRATGTGQGA